MRRWFRSQGHSGHQLGGRQSEWFLSKGMDWLGLGKQVIWALAGLVAQFGRLWGTVAVPQFPVLGHQGRENDQECRSLVKEVV